MTLIDRERFTQETTTTIFRVGKPETTRTGTQHFHRLQHSYRRQRHSSMARISLVMAALREFAELNAGKTGENSLG